MLAAATAALAGGHLLIEDVPGVGKTVLARALATSLGAELSRVQGHPDLLPSDITGVSVYTPDTGSWEFRPGPVFAHVVLVDELNRTPPRTQSALLETMEERQVSVDGAVVAPPAAPPGDRHPEPAARSGAPSRSSRASSTASPSPRRSGIPTPRTRRSSSLHAGGQVRPRRPAAGLHTGGVAPRAARHRVGAGAAGGRRVRGGAVPGQPDGARGASRREPPRRHLAASASAQARAVLSSRGYVVPDDVKAVAVGLSGPPPAHGRGRRQHRTGGRPGPPAPRDDARTTAVNLPGATGAARGADRRRRRHRRPVVAGRPQRRRRVGAAAGGRRLRHAPHRRGRTVAGRRPRPHRGAPRSGRRLRRAPGGPARRCLDPAPRAPGGAAGPRGLRRPGPADAAPRPTSITVVPERHGVLGAVTVDIASAAPFALQWWTRRVAGPAALRAPRGTPPRAARAAAHGAAGGGVRRGAASGPVPTPASPRGPPLRAR